MLCVIELLSSTCMLYLGVWESVNIMQTKTKLQQQLLLLQSLLEEVFCYCLIKVLINARYEDQYFATCVEFPYQLHPRCDCSCTDRGSAHVLINIITAFLAILSLLNCACRTELFFLSSMVKLNIIRGHIEICYHLD